MSKSEREIIKLETDFARGSSKAFAAVAQKAKQAEAQHRSMNSEIIARLEQSVEPKRVNPDEILRQAPMMRKKVKESLSAEEIQDAIDRGRP